jgi:hypothetical protein
MILVDDDYAEIRESNDIGVSFNTEEICFIMYGLNESEFDLLPKPDVVDKNRILGDTLYALQIFHYYDEYKSLCMARFVSLGFRNIEIIARSCPPFLPFTMVLKNKDVYQYLFNQSDELNKDISKAIIISHSRLEEICTLENDRDLFHIARKCVNKEVYSNMLNKANEIGGFYDLNKQFIPVSQVDVRIEFDMYVYGNILNGTGFRVHF